MNINFFNVKSSSFKKAADLFNFFNTSDLQDIIKNKIPFEKKFNFFLFSFTSFSPLVFSIYSNLHLDIPITMTGFLLLCLTFIYNQKNKKQKSSVLDALECEKWFNKNLKSKSSWIELLEDTDLLFTEEERRNNILNINNFIKNKNCHKTKAEVYLLISTIIEYKSSETNLKNNEFLKFVEFRKNKNSETFFEKNSTFHFFKNDSNSMSQNYLPVEALEHYAEYKSLASRIINTAMITVPLFLLALIIIMTLISYFMIPSGIPFKQLVILIMGMLLSSTVIYIFLNETVNSYQKQKKDIKIIFKNNSNIYHFAHEYLSSNELTPEQKKGFLNTCQNYLHNKESLVNETKMLMAYAEYMEVSAKKQTADFANDLLKEYSNQDEYFSHQTLTKN